MNGIFLLAHQKDLRPDSFRLFSEKEKNGFKKAFFRVRRKPEEAGGQRRPPLRVRWKICGCTDALELLPDPHPSASQTPSPEGKAIRCGGDRADGCIYLGKKKPTLFFLAEKEKNGFKKVNAETAFWAGGR